MAKTYEIPDDSGFLGVFDPDAYVSFVDEHWTLEQLFAHFREQMLQERLLLWGTGRDGWWRFGSRVGAAMSPASARTLGASPPREGAVA